jgi:hypothetical protein
MEPSSSAAHARLRLNVSFHINYRSRINKIGRAVVKRSHFGEFIKYYNLLRTLMWEAGTAYGVLPLRLSLQGTRQHLDNFIPQLLATSGNKRRRIYRILLAIIVHKPVPERPGRSEPRVLSSSP